jgi:hypothetical protein
MNTYLYFTNQAAPAASGLLGVAVGGYFAAHNQKRERQHRRLSDQLAEFYGPMLALRTEILVRVRFGSRSAAPPTRNGEP